eukprot:144004-Pelagomonas_calceolata.AAC.1
MDRFGTALSGACIVLLHDVCKQVVCLWLQDHIASEICSDVSPQTTVLPSMCCAASHCAFHIALPTSCNHAHRVLHVLETKDAKVYVQDRLRAQADLVWDLIHEQGAHFYVCGDASSMAGAVRLRWLAS